MPAEALVPERHMQMHMQMHIQKRNESMGVTGQLKRVFLRFPDKNGTFESSRNACKALQIGGDADN